MPTISGLFVYPVKSLKGIELTTAQVGNAGAFLYDRHWLVVRESDGHFYTQRQLPRMALVETALPPEALLGEGWGNLGPDAALTLSAHGVEPLQVPLEPAADMPAMMKNVTCWGWSGIARDEGDEAAAWLSDFLRNPVRLVRYAGQPGAGSADADPARRPIDPKWRRWGEGYEVAFPDQYPLLLLSEDSLGALNERLDMPLPMNRFRPNIVVSGGSPFAEDKWVYLRAGDLELNLRKPCGRCKITTTNQTTAEVGQEPLRELRSFRSGTLLKWIPEPWWRNEVYLGWHTVTWSRGALTVGDTITVTATRDPSDEFYGVH
ncbi:hypothetical protein WJX81_002347 [Elliptochloris bilobata]|uniref:MOSC domain-containing protein n=1 Tax=Elliptochloris bilobata TaxID=381761 RepID=A0AAW1S210_9CHLO